MATIYENVAYLSQEIGPRPAGTEEEQKAALYITEQFQKESGLPAVIEDFRCAPDFEMPRIISCVIAILAMLLSIFAPVLNIILTVIAGIAAFIFAAEAFDIPVISRFFSRGMSQNVIAKYEPGYNEKQEGRKRKVVIIARYDSGKIARETTSPLFHFLPIIRWIELFGIIANFVVLLLRTIIDPMGVALVVFNILSIITMVICLLPILGMIFRQISAYNEAANCNAAGVAVLMELANRIGKARVPINELGASQANAFIHGREAAIEADLLPQDAEVIYDTSMEVGEDASQEDRLRAAKAAVAALSGRPVSSTLNLAFDEKGNAVEKPVEALYDSRKVPFEKEEAIADSDEIVEENENSEFDQAVQVTETVQASTAEPVLASSNFAPRIVEPTDSKMATQVLSAKAASQARRIAPVAYPAPQVPRPQSQNAGAVPDWFVKAQQNAKKPKEEPNTVQRSRYAQAYDAVQATMAAMREPEAAEMSDIERRLQALHDSLNAVPGATQQKTSDGQPLDATLEEVIAQSAVQRAEENKSAQNAAVQASETQEEISVKSQIVDETAEAPQPTTVPEEEIVIDQSTPVVTSPGKTGGLDALFGPMEAETAVESSQEVSVKTGETQAYKPIHLDLDEMRALVVPDSASADEAVSQNAVAKASDIDAMEEAQDKVVETFADIKEEEFPAASGKPATSERDPQSQLAAMRAAIPAIRLENEKTGEINYETVRANRAVTDLPSISMDSATDVEGLKQRAPLAESPTPSSGRVKDLRAVLPNFDTARQDLVKAGEEVSIDRELLRTNIPSLSGVLDEQNAAPTAAENTAVSQAASFAASSATGAFDPIGDELVEDIAPEERYIDDVDDSDYAETMTETGAFSGPGYLDMPESRMKRFFGRFRRQKSDDDAATSTREWLDVDEDFDAREVGAARGGWESFRTNDEEFDDDDVDEEEFDDFVVDEESFAEPSRESRGTRRSIHDTSRRSRMPHNRDYEGASDRSHRDSRHWNGGAFSGEEREKIGRVSTASEDTAQETEIRLDEATTGKSGEIFRFRHPEVDVEVWFVALGAELANNGGMSAFLSEHKSDLRGATIIELEGVGAGDLALVEKEGLYLARESSTRLKRLIQKCASTVGIRLGSTNMQWRNSATAYGLRQGCQSLQLVGDLDGKPAYFGEERDVLEEVDIDQLENSADLLMELVKRV